MARADRRRSLLRLAPAGQRVYAQVVPFALAYERELHRAPDRAGTRGARSRHAHPAGPGHGNGPAHTVLTDRIADDDGFVSSAARDRRLQHPCIRALDAVTALRTVMYNRAPREGCTLKTVAEFEIQYHQFLDAEGRAAGPLPEFARDPAELLKMYRLMTLVRTFDTKAINLQRTGKLGTYASCLGHEATHVGVGAAMRPETCSCPCYREYGAQFWRGVKHARSAAVLGRRRARQRFRPARRTTIAWCVPIGSQMLHAAGAAMAFKIRGEQRCAVAFIGDGGTSQGAFYEALNLAGARALPVVFVIVNNEWAISVPIEAQTATRTLAQKAIAAGIPGVQVDGNDIIAVRAHRRRSAGHARAAAKAPRSSRPSPTACSDHTTADDARRYRREEEVKDSLAHRAAAAPARLPHQAPARGTTRRKKS